MFQTIEIIPDENDLVLWALGEYQKNMDNSIYCKIDLDTLYKNLYEIDYNTYKIIVKCIDYIITSNMPHEHNKYDMFTIYTTLYQIRKRLAKNITQRLTSDEKLMYFLDTHPSNNILNLQPIYLEDI